jgi:hypothetical protein
MKTIEWLYDKEFEYVFKNIGKDLWEDLRQEVAVIVLEYDPTKLSELQSKGKAGIQVLDSQNLLQSNQFKIW